MSNVKIPKRWYLTENASRAVPDGHPDAARLLCPAGGEVPREVAARYGLLDPEPEQESEAEVESETETGEAQDTQDEGEQKPEGEPGEKDASAQDEDEPAKDDAKDAPKDEPAKEQPKARQPAANKARRAAPNKGGS